MAPTAAANALAIGQAFTCYVMINGLPDARLTKVEELVAYIEKHGRIDDLLFRGQREDKELVPKLGRLRPRDMTLAELEEKMLCEFRRTAPPYLEIVPQSETEWLAVAQHFGMATRLLDWTFNPLAALWFAVQRTPSDGDGVIWMLQSGHLDEAGPEVLTSKDVQLVRPRHIVGRIVSQLGMFTSHPVGKESVVALEADQGRVDHLKKLSIAKESFSEIRWVLDRCGVNAASIYPGLDGLCAHLQWAHTFEDDEGPYVEPHERAI